ncbi:hypothetical protein JMM81_05175 [Bacillus sp. V3B]|uniref:hypothetical protein n=1 Tax=Bacillus sp. V3B TaxID=2804915 RepID=UPI002108E699|nr:hypothetical protein [Bacillus sp. V3B]MCQ6274370.1 hypothetical protein [Bacillus sp. V3B]
MKSKHIYFAALCIILLLNVIFTQKMVHQFYYEQYTNTIILGLLNIVLFPLAFLIYKWDRKAEGKDE